ncbi:MAG: hypothetical protein HRU35_07115 [Rickettsiaceae bacterium]|nr:hypothetical protein [Rickettsiaceae bacterium]
MINTRLQEEGAKQIKNLDNYIVQKADLKNLVSLLDKELSLKDKKHKPFSNKQLSNFTDLIQDSIKTKKPLKNYKSFDSSSKFKEFCYKLKSVFIAKKIITRQIKNKKLSFSKKENIRRHSPNKKAQRKRTR